MLDPNTVKSSQDQRFFQNMGWEWGLNRVRANALTYLDFGFLRLQAGGRHEAHSGAYEILAVVLGGRCDVEVGGQRFGRIGKRPNVFAGPPFVVYIPPRTPYAVTARSAVLEVGLCMALENEGQPAPKPFLIEDRDVDVGVLGAANFTRDKHSFPTLDEQDPPLHRLELGETYTPSGNWSTFPPHLHEIDAGGQPRTLEEICYYRIDPPEGFGLLKHYTEDGQLDNVYTCRDNSFLMVDRGYHPWVSAPGYCGYHLWFHGGEAIGLRPRIDPALAWVGKTVPMLRQRQEGK
jgi:5-deoxy-glucuronate isomerase